MILQRRLLKPNKKKIKDTIVEFTTSGTYTWTVPAGITEVDVFLVGGGGGGYTETAGGGGYTKAFRGDNYIKPVGAATWEPLSDGGRDGNAISVTPGENIQIIVGAGGAGASGDATGRASNGGYSQFKNPDYRANGGEPGLTKDGYYAGGYGGSGGASRNAYGGSDGGRGSEPAYSGYGQGHTTKDFGENIGKVNAGGGGGANTNGSSPSYAGGSSGYPSLVNNAGNPGSSVSGSAPGLGGGGYGGGGGAGGHSSSGYGRGGNGGAGKVMIRY